MISPSRAFRLSELLQLTAYGLFASLAVLGSNEPLVAGQPVPLAEVPDDVRLGPLKDLNGYFPFHVPADEQQWEQRALQLRQQVLVSQGLWPMPTKKSLNAVIHGRRDMGDYTVEKVYFESMPGLFVTGNLYRPRGAKGRVPGVLCPHGHWANGRFYDCGNDAVRKLIVQGAERFEDGGRNPLQSRCVQLARMGCVVFHYDMLGYADSQQLSSQLIHRFSKQRPEMNDPVKWGLFSPQAESRLQSAMGLQTYNSIRAIDFLLELPDVDSERIAVTGASGGGTQSFMLAAVDPRITVAFPAVMVSTAMQGGCTCENACCLRVATGNVEIAALFAPKPLGLTAADDWTVEMATKGFPQLQQLYGLLGAPNSVSLTALTHFGHNYNYVSRAAMYSWLNRHLKLRHQDPIVEERYTRLGKEELTVWNAQHPAPPSGENFERQLLQWWDTDSRQQLDALLPTSAATVAKYQETIRAGLSGIIGRALPAPQDLKMDVVATRKGDGFQHTDYMVTFNLPPILASGANQEGKADGIQEQIPLLVLQPSEPNGMTCLLLHPAGKAGVFENRLPSHPVRQLLEAGTTVCAADLFGQGAFLVDGQEITSTRRVENPREAAAYTFGYNPTLFAHRTHDVLTLLGLFTQTPPFVDGTYETKELVVAGNGYTGPVAAVAAGLVPDCVDRLAVDDADFRFAHVDAIHSPMFLPGGCKYHDLPGILALSAPKPLWLSSAAELPAALQAAYQDHADQVVSSQAADRKLAAIVDWILQ